MLACCEDRPRSAPAPRAAAPPGAPESPRCGARLDRVIRAEATVARRTSGRWKWPRNALANETRPSARAALPPGACAGPRPRTHTARPCAAPVHGGGAGWPRGRGSSAVARRASFGAGGPRGPAGRRAAAATAQWPDAMIWPTCRRRSAASGRPGRPRPRAEAFGREPPVVHRGPMRRPPGLAGGSQAYGAHVEAPPRSQETNVTNLVRLCLG